MPVFERYGVSLYYEDFGPRTGFPVLLLAPGSFQSTIDWWHSGGPVSDPTEYLKQDFRVIAMDQRNAGKSRALITSVDGWHSFTEDHVALLDYLGVDKVHVVGACIGVSFALRLIQVQPWRVASAVLQQPIGTLNPHPSPSDGFGRWRETITDHPEATDDAMKGYAANLYASDFVYCVSRDFVSSCDTPFLILPGNDKAHPHEIAVEIDRLAPNSEFIEDWKEGPAREGAFERVVQFLHDNTPTTESRRRG